VLFDQKRGGGPSHCRAFDFLRMEVAHECGHRHQGDGNTGAIFPPISKTQARTHKARGRVYRGQTYLGTVKLAGKASAYAPNGKRVGVFTSLEAATDALDKPEAIE
jgi:hypothetical protein